MNISQLAVSEKKKLKLRSHLCLFITVTIWASTFVNIKFVLPQVPPNTLAFLRFFIASIVLGLFSLLTKQPKIERKDWLRVAVCGLTGISLYNFFQNQGLKYAGATDAAILASMAPVFMALLGWLVLKEKVTRKQVGGIIAAFSGSVLVATNGSLDSFVINTGRLWGDFLVLLTGVAWGFYNIALKKLLERYPAITILTYSSLVGTIFLFPLMLFETPDLLSINFWGWFNVFYLGLLASALAYLFWNQALTRISTVTAGAYLYLIPLIAAAIAFIFLNEIPSIYIISGGVLILIGTYLAGSSA